MAVIASVQTFNFGNYMYATLFKSLDRSRSGSHFHGTEYEIWADFGSVGNTEKKLGGRLWATFELGFFMFLWAKKTVKTFLKTL